MMRIFKCFVCLTRGRRLWRIRMRIRILNRGTPLPAAFGLSAADTHFVDSNRAASSSLQSVENFFIRANGAILLLCRRKLDGQRDGQEYIGTSIRKNLNSATGHFARFAAIYLFASHISPEEDEESRLVIHRNGNWDQGTAAARWAIFYCFLFLAIISS